MPRLLTVAWFALLVIWSAGAEAQLQPPNAGDGVYRSDGDGRAFRVEFPLHDRLWLRGGFEAGSDPTAIAALGWSLKLNADFPDEEIWWQLRHQIATVEFRPSSLRAQWVLRTVDADYLRHDVASTILVPRPRKDIRLPAPFDIAVIWSLLAASISPTTDQALAGVEVARLALLADFLRDGDYRHRLAAGFEARYDALNEEGSWRHEVVPFSAVTVVWGWEHRTGRFAAMVRPTLERVATLQVGANDPSWGWRFTADAEVEWVLLAVNDAPFSMLLQGAVQHGFGGETVATAGLGARLALPLGL